MSRAAQAKAARTEATALRNGSEFLRSLDDGRQIFLDGERVGKVIGHPAFRGAAFSIARLFDIAAAPEMRERMTFTSPKTGGPGVARLANPALACRSQGQAPVLGNLGGSDLRADGPDP